MSEAKTTKLKNVWWEYGCEGEMKKETLATTTSSSNYVHNGLDREFVYKEEELAEIENSCGDLWKYFNDRVQKPKQLKSYVLVFMCEETKQEISVEVTWSKITLFSSDTVPMISVSFSELGAMVDFSYADIKALVEKEMLTRINNYPSRDDYPTATVSMDGIRTEWNKLSNYFKPRYTL